MSIFRRDSRADPDRPPRPPEFRPPAEDAWAPGAFGASRSAGRGPEGDPCGSGPVKDSSDEEGAGA